MLTLVALRRVTCIDQRLLRTLSRHASGHAQVLAENKRRWTRDKPGELAPRCIAILSIAYVRCFPDSMRRHRHRSIKSNRWNQ
jgi:hypothetical protein